MKKIELYIDFDGVILDTINATYRMLKENYNVDLIEHYHQAKANNELLIREFYYNLDWYSLLRETKEINNSIENIKKVVDSGLYDPKILTHVNSENEAKEKIIFSNERIPGIEVIPTPKTIDKCDMVNPLDAILVDDFIGNLVPWYKKGGIPIKFSDSGKKSNFLTITSLEQLINCYDEINNTIVRNKIRRKKRGS